MSVDLTVVATTSTTEFADQFLQLCVHDDHIRRRNQSFCFLWFGLVEDQVGLFVRVHVQPFFVLKVGFKSTIPKAAFVNFIVVRLFIGCRCQSQNRPDAKVVSFLGRRAKEAHVSSSHCVYPLLQQWLGT
jgi:hypothetical protein